MNTCTLLVDHQVLTKQITHTCTVFLTVNRKLCPVNTCTLLVDHQVLTKQITHSSTVFLIVSRKCSVKTCTLLVKGQVLTKQITHSCTIFLTINRKCPDNTTCRQVGDNPNYGYTNFDNIGSAFLMAFQLLTMDFWENQYNKVSHFLHYI